MPSFSARAWAPVRPFPGSGSPAFALAGISLRGQFPVYGGSASLPDCGGILRRSTMLLPKRLAG